MDRKVDVVVVTKDPTPRFCRSGGIPTATTIVETSTPLAKARQRAIAKVETDWFVFIDDDIILPDDWWKTLDRQIHFDSFGQRPFAQIIGAVQGTAIPYGLGDAYDRRFAEHFSNLPEIRMLNGNSRMFTHNTLIRRSAVEDWNPPADLEAYEDYHMMRHIQKRGYKVFVVKTETYHKYSWSKLWPMGRWGTRGMLRFFPASRVLANFFGIPLEYLRHGFRIGTVNAVKQTAGLYELVFGGR